MKTLTGFTLDEMRARLDAEFPPHAYKPVPGGAQLTDIDPAYMRHCLNDVFGLCGYGWGYDFDPNAIQLSAAPGNKGISAAVLAFTLWYKLVDADDEVVTYTIPATGGSDNREPQFAIKGAITNAIGHAASNLGFQESVYMGQRSHATVKKAPARAAKATTQPPAKAASTAKSPRTSHHPAAQTPTKGNGGGMTLEEAGRIVLPFGTRTHPDYKDQSLGELERRDAAFITWAAENAPRPEIRQACGVIVAHRVAT